MIRPVLCIIDVQPYFAAAQEVVAGVLDQIKSFKENNRPIILARFHNCGPSYNEIIEALRGYEKAHHVCKSDDDGSQAIMLYAKKSKLSIKHMVLCGVNTCCCVSETAISLARRGHKIHLSEKALSCFCKDKYGCIKTLTDDLVDVYVAREKEKHAKLTGVCERVIT